MDTELSTEEPTLETSPSRVPARLAQRDDDISAALALLVKRVSEPLPDDVIHTYAGLRRTQIRLRRLIAAAERKIATNRRKVAKVRATIRELRSHIDTLNAEISGKHYAIERYEQGVSSVYILRRLVEQGELCIKRPHILDWPADVES